jgi:hypothetical protein
VIVGAKSVTPPEASKFAEAARAARCDEDAERFEDRLKRVVRYAPAKETKKPAK